MAQGDIDRDFDAAIEVGKINGVHICATDAQGQFIYNKTIGNRTLLSGEEVPHRLDDVLFLASASKLLTSIAALTCVEDGLVSLTGDLASIIPELSKKQVLTGFSGSDEPTLESPKQHITLEMLITHSSGLTYYFLDPKIAKWRGQYTPQALDPNADMKYTVEELFTYPLSFQPGEDWMYGTGLDWAGRVVELVTGRSLLERLKERVFTPLGIEDAQFHPVTHEDLRERMVDLNPQDPEGLGAAVLGGDGSANKNTKGAFGGQGLFMTAQDYIKVLQSLLANDGKILKPSTVDDMFENHLSPAATEGLTKACTSPFGPAFLVGNAPDSKLGYGLGGLLTLQDVPGWHGEKTLSWGGGLTFTWFIDRKNDLCGLGALQARIPVDFQATMDLKQAFRTDIYRKREQWKTQQNR